MAYLQFGDIRRFTRIVDSRGTKVSIVGAVVCVDTTNHKYIIIDTNGDEWDIGIGRSEVSSAKVSVQEQTIFNKILRCYNRIYDLNERASEIEADIVYNKTEVRKEKEKLRQLNSNK